ncbi:hypothetical protein, partial [Pseudomonas phage vB_Pae_BR133a]
ATSGCKQSDGLPTHKAFTLCDNQSMQVERRMRTG